MSFDLSKKINNLSLEVANIQQQISSATGSTGSGLPTGAEYGEYLYYDTSGNEWKVGGATTTNNNVRIGRNAGYFTTGSNNVCLGNAAGYTPTGLNTVPTCSVIIEAI